MASPVRPLGAPQSLDGVDRTHYGLMSNILHLVIIPHMCRTHVALKRSFSFKGVFYESSVGHSFGPYRQQDDDTTKQACFSADNAKSGRVMYSRLIMNSLLAGVK